MLDDEIRIEPGATAHSPEIELGARAWRAVLLDLDGTLLDARGEISARTREAICEITRRDVSVMIVTGRSLASAAAAVESLDLSLPLVCFNGGTFYCTRRRRVLRNLILDREIAAQVLPELEQLGLDFFVSHGDDKFTLPASHPEYASAIRDLLGVTEVASVPEIPIDAVSRVTVLGEPARVLAHRERVLERFGPRVYLEDFHLSALPSHRESSLHTLDLHPPSAGKAEAIHYLEEHHGVLRQDLIAIGDGRNDLSMMRLAGLGVAPANAHPMVISAADQVIGHHDQDGVAIFLEETFLGQ